MTLGKTVTRRQRFRYLFALAGGGGLLLAAVALAVAYVVDFRDAGSVPVIAGIAITPAENAPPSLVISGSGIDPSLEAALLPSPIFNDSVPRSLVPRTALFHLDVGGDLAIASGRGRRLLTVDVRDGHPPRILGSLQIRVGGDSSQSGVTALVMSGSRAVVSLGGKDGLVLVDLADPTALRQLDYLPFNSDFTDLLALDGGIVAAGVKSGLWWIDITGDRLRITPLPDSRRAWRLARHANRLVAVGLDGDLALYELAGDAAPRLVARERIPAEIRGVALTDRSLYLCQADGFLREFSTARWPRLEPQAELRLPGRALRLVSDRDAPLLYCLLVGAGAAAIDVSRPGQPAVAGWLNTRSAISALFAAQGRLVYVNGNGLMIRSAAELQRQQLSFIVPFDAGREKIHLKSWQGLTLGYDYKRVALLDRHHAGAALARAPAELLLALEGDREVRFFARQRGALVQVAGLPVSYVVQATFVRGDRLYVLGDKILEIYACTEAAACELLGRLEGFAVAEALAWVDPDFLLVTDRVKGLKLVSVREPSRPRVVAELPVPAFLQGSGGGTYDALVNGRWAYVSRGTLGIEVVDLADPEKMHAVRLLDTPGSVRRLLLTQGLLLAADRGQGLQVYDTHGPDCRWLGTIATASNVEALIRQQDDILIASAASTIAALTAPVRLGKLQSAGDDATSVRLPDGLPAGRYRLVVYGDDGRITSADLTLP